MALEDRDCINAGQSIIAEYKTRLAALRTKQPAASEGDGRVNLQQFRPAVVNWRNEQRGTIKQLEDSVSQLGSGIQKLAEDRLREADRLLAIIDNTSKQAAGEAVIEPPGITSLREELPRSAMKDVFWLSRDEAQYLLDRADDTFLQPKSS